jgi:hypothetical protein
MLGAGQASDCFSERLREHVLIEREIRDQSLQPSVLLFELPSASQLAHTQMGIFLLPRIECRFSHTLLPTDVSHRRTTLRLAERVDHLLLGELRPLHGVPPFPMAPSKWHLTLV